MTYLGTPQSMLSLSSSCSACLMLALCICFLTELRALVLFVVDETGKSFPVEPSPDATVGDLCAEIADIRGFPAERVALSFQGHPLTDWSEPLADTGMTDECLLSMAVKEPVIELQFLRGDHDQRMNESSNVLQWDTAKHLAEFAWLRELNMLEICIYFNFNGTHQKGIHFLHRYSQFLGIDPPMVASHAFFIERIDGEQEGVDEISGRKDVTSRDLQQAEYAKDLLVAPVHGGAMELFCENRLGNTVYRFPTGYALRLRYLNRTQS